MKSIFKILSFTLIVLLQCVTTYGQEVQDREVLYYKIINISIPDRTKLEVGGMAFNDKGQLAVATRHGEIWLIDDPKEEEPKFALLASGLHEPLGLAFYKGAYYTAQRGELTKITDTDHDGNANLFETVSSWQLSGNYHEYSYGPLFLPDGNMMITRNLGWQEDHRHMESFIKWSGWMLKVSQKGQVKPFATGMRSPAGFGLNAKGDLFYAENQGDWIGSGWITHVEKGDFTGHPEGLKWSHEPNTPVQGFTLDLFPDSVGTMYQFAKKHPDLQFKLPAVWFPQGIMGTSTSDIINIDPAEFGPFKDQLLVGDQGQSMVMRVALEKVNGAYQGACFPFLEGFSSGVFRLLWGKEPILYVGMTSRGWHSTGESKYGLQKVTWTGKTPFEMKTIHAKPYGFEIDFTLPVDKAIADNKESYKITGFTYLYHSSYGSPIINKQNCEIEKIKVSKDGKRLKLYMNGLREGYIHEIKLQNLKSAKGVKLLHSFAYYTLNNIPEGHIEHALALKPTTEKQTTEKENACPVDQSKTVTMQPDDWTDGPDKVITINTIPGLKFDKPEFEVKAGSRVKLIFNNNDDMLHNLVIVNPGKMDEVGKAALNMGIDGPNQGYTPDVKEVLHATCLLQPGALQAIYFTVPEKSGNYPFLCTYPGHYLIMNGIMKVIQ